MPVERLAFAALGSTCEVLAVGVSRERLALAAAWVLELHQRLTRFDPQSELSRFNALAGRRVPVSPVLEELLRASLEAWEVSGGLVHAGILPALVAAGYSRPLDEGATTALAPPPPPPALPDMLTVGMGWARLRPGAQVDLGGLAKGWMADRLATSIGDNALANLGGDLFGHGGGPGGDGWPVGFGGRTVLLAGQGAATSSTVKRRWGPGRHHLIDPRSGLPSGSDLREVSVIAASGLQAEILAKAALLLGREDAPLFLMPRALGWSFR